MTPRPEDDYSSPSDDRRRGHPPFTVSFGRAPARVFRRGSNQDIEVAGVPWPTVKSQTVSADYYVLNAAGV